MTRDEKGYVQFHCEWEQTRPLPPGPEIGALLRWRDRLREVGLLGAYPDGVGFGNVSHRVADSDSFLVSGTRTGHLATLGPEHVTRVTMFDFDRNLLVCRGPVQASSESLSHAAVYRSEPSTRFVVHVHHLDLWRRLRDHAPTTDPSAEAGTPAMARAIQRLFRDPAVRREGLFVMGGHREGLMSFGATPDQAGERILAAYRRMDRPPTARDRVVE